MSPSPADALIRYYQAVRTASVALATPLTVEDQVIQTMRDVSPTKWHLAHTTWFFETMVLHPHAPDYQSFHPRYRYLFNSYYNAIGPQFRRARRGVLSRPTVDDVSRYRRHVDEHLARFLQEADETTLHAIEPVIRLGLNHEQQHQELTLTDIKHVFSCNPLRPAYREGTLPAAGTCPPQSWRGFPEQLAWIGHAADAFAYDNESPRHRVWLDAFELGSRLVTNGEFITFIADRGYERPELWLSDGWDAVCDRRWTAPLYCERDGGGWCVMTLAGMQDLDPASPVCHVSFFEADAFARWAGARLPTEAEWEIAAAAEPIEGNFLERRRLHPAAAAADAPDCGVRQLFGDVWEWTASPYVAYPGYRPATGALGEYNAKFMSNQMVLRGGSCATPQSHIRGTYRNFFPPGARWQFSGLRLARHT
ncbi:MAG: ergothioneine biosynthesis protein EgtB [Phycisphaerae bacterium]